MMGKRSKGQGTLEYILVLLAILLAVIVGSNTQVKTAIGNLFTDIQARIDDAGDRINPTVRPGG